MNKKGFAPLWCRITINKKQIDFSIGINVRPRDWDGFKVANTCCEAMTHNVYLDNLRARINSVYMDRSLRGLPVSPGFLKETVFERSSGIMFSRMMEEYFADELPLKTFTESTFEKYSYIRNNIECFLRENHFQSMLIDEFDIPFSEKMKKWLYAKLRCSKSHCSRHLRVCRDILRVAVKKGYIKFNAIVQIELEKDPVKEVVALSIDEIRKINSFQFANPIYVETWHLFLFQCYTGLSYGDLWKFEVGAKFDQLWIFNQHGRHKNGKYYAVPLFDVARQILIMYQGKLPLQTNQSYNRLIKEVAKLAGVGKYLTTHTARKTFANMKDEEGWSLDGIARMMGNSEKVVRAHYVVGTENRIVAEMDRLRIRA
jgi:integrase/recombinase XerD